MSFACASNGRAAGAHLPNDMLGCILAFLPWADFVRCVRVCRQWNRVVEMLPPRNQSLHVANPIALLDKPRRLFRHTTQLTIDDAWPFPRPDQHVPLHEWMPRLHTLSCRLGIGAWMQLRQMRSLTLSAPHYLYANAQGAAIVKQLAQALPHLQFLHMWGDGVVDYIHLVDFAQLETLQIGHATDTWTIVTDMQLFHILRAPSLRQLHMGRLGQKHLHFLGAETAFQPPVPMPPRLLEHIPAIGHPNYLVCFDDQMWQDVLQFQNLTFLEVCMEHYDLGHLFAFPRLQHAVLYSPINLFSEHFYEGVEHWATKLGARLEPCAPEHVAVCTFAKAVPRKRVWMHCPDGRRILLDIEEAGGAVLPPNPPA